MSDIKYPNIFVANRQGKYNTYALYFAETQYSNCELGGECLTRREVTRALKNLESAGLTVYGTRNGYEWDYERSE